MILITVTYPNNKTELAMCVASFRRFNPSGFQWLFITEHSNKAEIQKVIPGEWVVSMNDINPALETMPSGFCRQNAAKLESISALMGSLGNAVFVDDDVTAQKQWTEDVFVSPGGMPVVWFERESNYTWMFGQHLVFGSDCPRVFQLRLPFAISCQTLRELRASGYGQRALREWSKGNAGVSEFQVMGEFAFRKSPTKNEFLANRQSDKKHWTLDLGIFKDWQKDRKAMRASISDNTF